MDNSPAEVADYGTVTGMGRREQLPEELGDAFPVHLARWNGVSRSRLRGSDVASPFYGARIKQSSEADEPEPDDPYQRQRLFRVTRARQYAPRLHGAHFFSHETAASIWGAPLPLAFSPHGTIAGFDDMELHVCASGDYPFPRAAGVHGHRTLLSMTAVVERDGLRVSSPAATWASLGTLSVVDLVALGDFFCRRWRPGHGRPNVGRAPLTTVEELRTMLDAGRRRGAARLREAIEAIREDAWSPRESQVRCILIGAGLPEPALNIDVRDRHGRFLGCVDMAYPEPKVAIEYLGMLHGRSWAQDVERIAGLRAAGWTVIEVTSPLLNRPEELIRRVRAALAR